MLIFTRTMAPTLIKAKMYIPDNRLSFFRKILVMTAPRIAVRGRIPIRMA